MSSRSIGLRSVTGASAVNNFMHRERMITHKAIITNKRRLRWTVVMHVLFLVVVTLRLSVALCVLGGLRPPRFLQKFNLPKVVLWEWVWFVGALLSVLVGYFGLTRNRILYVRGYILFTTTLGLVPSLYAGYLLYPSLRAYWETRVATKLLFGQPVVVIWFMFLIGAVQLHLYGALFARGLLKAWHTRIDERKKAAAMQAAANMQ